MIRENGLALETSGLELAYEYYTAVGKPVMEEKFPDIMEKAAVGLVGEGSECFGYDDKISMDHDYGPAFCIWLPEKEYERIGKEMNQVYKALPKEFKGIRPQIQREQAGERRGVLQIERFYKRFLGSKVVPESLMDWLVIPEHCLAVTTNGRVFQDNLGEFTGIRKQLLSYYPEDVRLKKLAARLATMAHYGQCNYSRMMRRDDTVAAFLALESFVSSTMAAVYLLNRQYAPYYKWMWRGMEKLERLKEIRSLLKFFVETGIHRESWNTDKWDTFQYRLNDRDTIVMLIEEICALIAAELKRQGISSSSSDYLEDHAYGVMDCIQDDRIRSMSVLAF